ncbi:hypothetical protein EYC80_006949 [Monilinia laxa]|uniref:Uncharacterized protein n=1 Tax=Monilinia laxa TaxID=61186 RepID=A0A5N6JZP9_MONLA|nr:hypothetical protein EYC80_006949 [Monilinia laxa]
MLIEQNITPSLHNATCGSTKWHPGFQREPFISSRQISLDPIAHQIAYKKPSSLPLNRARRKAKAKAKPRQEETGQPLLVVQAAGNRSGTLNREGGGFQVSRLDPGSLLDKPNHEAGEIESSGWCMLRWTIHGIL